MSVPNNKIKKHNADLKNVDVSSFEIPSWLIDLVNGKLKEIFGSISKPKLIPLIEILEDKKLLGQNAGREKGVNKEKVNGLQNKIELKGWKDGELCILIKVKNPSNMSSVLYHIYFTLHRYSAAVQVQVHWGVVNPVLPCVFLTVKDGVSDDQLRRAISTLSDRENLKTSFDLDHNPYKKDDKVYNTLLYINTFPDLNDDQKWAHLQNEWKEEQLETGLISKPQINAVLAEVKKRLDVFTPMMYYNNQKDRKDWVVNNYDGKFEYFGLPIVNLDLNSKKIQYPFGKEGRACFIDYWKEEDENRDFGNLLARYSDRFDQKMKKVPTLIFLDCNQSKAGVDLEDDRKKRVQSIEKQIKLLAPEIRDLIHFVSFLPQCTQSDDLTTMISYTKLKENLLNENS